MFIFNYSHESLYKGQGHDVAHKIKTYSFKILKKKTSCTLFCHYEIA